MVLRPMHIPSDAYHERVIGTLRSVAEGISPNMSDRLLRSARTPICVPQRRAQAQLPIKPSVRI